MAKVFKRNGYRTGHFGKWHLGGGCDVGDAYLPQAYGFDQSLVSFEGLGDRLLFKNDGLSNASGKLGKICRYILEIAIKNTDYRVWNPGVNIKPNHVVLLSQLKSLS
ncbi:hypothetical protein [Echinicola shivajiensis]|uniref:hypothetical protein n=1 Tax=Echinicola shivajiensis TaxID=1035916 RepID=UPI001BFC9B29